MTFPGALHGPRIPSATVNYIVKFTVYTGIPGQLHGQTMRAQTLHPHATSARLLGNK